ncbi:MAG: CoA ester lyase [Rudaea sp.]|uniref:HpcH/HpaI aldolase/citrate lyase family protein n=1 Tax=Rudaea sp. TaxID=2136325 RepID=UPI0039E2548A
MNALRSLLFVPADSPRKLARGLETAADVLILDLEDAVAASRKLEARAAAAAFVAEHANRAKSRLFVRINPLCSGLALADLAAVVGAGLAGIVLPKTREVADIVRAAHYLDALEAHAGLPAGQIGILPVATETAQAMLTMDGYRTPPPRLVGVTWGAEDLSAAIGAASNREDDGAYSSLYLLARSMCLCAAASSGVGAIDTLHADFRDAAGLERACRESRRRGFKGRIAIHPDQVEIINTAYSPTEDELASARRVVAAFDAGPGAGVVSIDGVMYDLPHLKQARLTLGLES